MKKRSVLRLVDTGMLNHGQWSAVRNGGISSSDAAAAVGLCPYKTQLKLWMEKTGRLDADGDHHGADEPSFWDTLLEPYVAVAYQRKTSRRVRRVNTMVQHPTLPFMLAKIDREVVGDPHVPILQCNTVGEHGFRLWREGVPLHIQLQVQHQLAVTGRVIADVAVLLCGQNFEVHRLERDDEVIARLMVLESCFWRYVESDQPPPVEGSELAAKALRHLYQGKARKR